MHAEIDQLVAAITKLSENIAYATPGVMTWEELMTHMDNLSNWGHGEQTKKKEREKADFIAKIEDPEMTIDGLAKAIDTLKAEIAEMQVQLTRGGEDRDKQNKVPVDRGGPARDAEDASTAPGSRQSWMPVEYLG